VRLPCVTPSLPLWRAPSDRFPLRRILRRPLRPERVEKDCHLGKPALCWKESPLWIVLLRAVQIRERHPARISTHTHTTALPCLFCTACLPGLAAAAPTSGRLTLQLQRILVEISAASARPTRRALPPLVHRAILSPHFAGLERTSLCPPPVRPEQQRAHREN